MGATIFATQGGSPCISEGDFVQHEAVNGALWRREQVFGPILVLPFDPV